MTASSNAVQNTNVAKLPTNVGKKPTNVGKKPTIVGTFESFLYICLILILKTRPNGDFNSIFVDNLRTFEHESRLIEDFLEVFLYKIDDFEFRAKFDTNDR